ncbi:hypothetical protein WKW79_20500 [Variovorax robiniae]|uniref:Uncharacterized protein n=1 Tax=Variovorax robiniae TaxID=1836199 RepID=A0ABU8XAV2_9BURK
MTIDPRIPKTGKPTGILKAFTERTERQVEAALARSSPKDPTYNVAPDPIDPYYVLVPLDGEPHLKARLSRSAYGFCTRRKDQRTDPGLTRARWFRDEEGMVRAHCRWDTGTKYANEGVLVVAMIHDLQKGDTISMVDPLNLSDHKSVTVVRRIKETRRA